MINHAMKRLETLESELGRDIAGAGDWWMNDTTGTSEYRDPEGGLPTERTFMGKRRLYDLVSQNNVEHRAYIQGGIFAESNLVVPLARKIARQMTARAVNYYFGTDPWFSVYPVGENDRDRAGKADRYVRWKLDQAKLKRTEEQGIERSFNLGEAVVKTSWADRSEYYQSDAIVLVDEDGNDILGVDGDFIFETDQWVPQILEDPETGEVVESGVIVLKRDGETPLPENLIWQQKLITRKITHYRGPEAKIVHFLDFLCPLDAETVQTSDCCVHLYDMPVMDLADQWKKAVQDGTNAEGQKDETMKAISLIEELSHASSEPKSGQNTTDNNMGSGSAFNRSERTEPVAEIAEFYLRYDANGDGLLEDVILVIDKKTRTPIFYDYVANVTEDGTRPFSVIRVNEVPGRWYGIGAIEMFESSQQIVDLLINRWNFSQTKSARVDFWRPENTLEGRANPSLTLNWGGSYTPLPGKTAKDCLESVYLENNTKDNIKELAEFFMQLMVNESGVSNANDSNVAGLQSTKLATGIRNIEKSGQELFSLFLGHLEPGISESLNKMVRLIFARLDELEVSRFFEDKEGGEGSAEIIRIDPGEIADMEVDVRVLLTRYRGEQILESSIRASDIVDRYYAQPYEIQIMTAKMYQDMLKALQISNADEIIQPMQIGLPPTSGGMPDASQVAKTARPRERKSEPNF